MSRRVRIEGTTIGINRGAVAWLRDAETSEVLHEEMWFGPGSALRAVEEAEGYALDEGWEVSR